MSSKAHFDISAAVIKQLGEELVSDEITAIIELVKNAYDADASYANIVIDTEEVLNTEGHPIAFAGSKGYISIEDDGSGMTGDEIRDGWLLVSASPKRAMKAAGKRTLEKGRTPLGDKGLGRLSTQRLGYQLEMHTCKRKTKTEYFFSVDWRQFTENMRLSEVPVELRAVHQAHPRTGTKLTISGLRNSEVWLGKSQDDLINKLSQLLFPFEELRPFNVYVTINGNSIDLDVGTRKIRDLALSRWTFGFDGAALSVSGRIKLSRMRGSGDVREEQYERLLLRDSGRQFFAYLTNPSNRLALPHATYLGKGGWFISINVDLNFDSLGEKVRSDNSLANPGKFNGELDEFFLRGVELNNEQHVFSETSEYQSFVRRQIGVRIFRDGFGIRPYGIEGNDWLNLGGNQTSGLSFYGLRPQNVIGFVALTGEANGRLQEKTDREGFVDTAYTRNFFLLMQQVVKTINTYYNSLLRSYTEYARQHAQEALGFVSDGAIFNEMRATAARAHTFDAPIIQIEERLNEVTAQIGPIVDRAEHTPLLASEQERHLAPFLKDTQAVVTEAHNIVGQLRVMLQQAERLASVADTLQPKLEILEQQLREFSELAGLGLTAEALSHEIHTITDRLSSATKNVASSIKQNKTNDADIVAYTEYVYSAISALRRQLSHLAPSLRYVRERQDRLQIRPFFDEIQSFYADRFRDSGIEIILGKPFDDFRILMNRGKLTQVVDNLILNSEYWLKEAVHHGSITDPRITVTAKQPIVTIADNGIGVDPSLEELIFQPFVTTKPSNIGRGLGLFIVQQLLDSSTCAISLLPERNQFGRRYIFQIDLTGALDGR